jgi:hypothetical protein
MMMMMSMSLHTGYTLVIQKLFLALWVMYSSSMMEYSGKLLFKLRLMHTWQMEHGLLALCLLARRLSPCCWVFAIKYNADGTVERLKVGLIARGFTQRSGFDYVEIFALTVRMASICTVLALVAIEDLDLHSVDISHAYINGTLEEEIYMQQPDGFHFGKPGNV